MSTYNVHNLKELVSNALEYAHAKDTNFLSTNFAKKIILTFNAVSAKDLKELLGT